jgi:two-component system LytT family response regulator
MIRCYILDDEQPAIDILHKYISDIPELLLVGTNTNPLDAIDFIKKNNIGLIFLDIQMDEMNGLEVIKTLGNKYKYVLCTAYSEFAVNGYDLDAVDYLLKPITFERFERALFRVDKSIHLTSNPNKNSSDDYIFVKTESKGKRLKIDLSDILFIEAKSNYVAFQLEQKKILSHISLKELEEKLSHLDFLRVHKSFIIPLQRITAVQNSEIHLKNVSTPIPLSASYKVSFMQKVSSNFIG